MITDPNVYLAKDHKSFRMGTKKQAKEEGWVSMPEARKEYPDEEAFVKKVSNITMLSKEEITSLEFSQNARWDVFEQKISNFFAVYFALHIFKKYTRQLLLKYIRNGYDRLEFRAFLGQLVEYDNEGNIVKTHD